MIRFEKSIEIDAPVGQVFAYLLDPKYAPEYMTNVSEVKDIQRLPDGGYTYTATSKFMGLHGDSKVEQTEVIPNERIVERMSGAGMDGTITERIESLEGDKTRVTLVTETTLHAGPLAKFGEVFVEKYFEHGQQMAMEAAKAHLETAAHVHSA